MARRPSVRHNSRVVAKKKPRAEVAAIPPSKVRYPESGERLAALRSMTGLSQVAFAASVGIAQNTWNQIENGVSRPSLDNALLLVRRYGVTLDWVYLGNVAGMPSGLLSELSAKRK